MQKSTHDKYLGDMISADGKIYKNIESRVSKGLGIVTEVMNMLEKVTLGSHYFRTAILLRESRFLNGILTNAESWYGLSSTQISQLESVDRLLIRKILGTPVSTPIEALYLELGIMSIGTIIKARRINFLHYLLTRNESEMVYKVFCAQWNRPVRNDWTVTVRQDLKDFNIEEDLQAIKSKSKGAFKKLVKGKALEFEFTRLMTAKQPRSKLMDLSYSKLELQEYLKLEHINRFGAQTVFKYRVRMANFGENFRGKRDTVPCPLCGQHLDNQKMNFENCQVIRDNVQISGVYQDIFKTNIPSEIVSTLQEIDKFREQTLKQND